MDGWAACFIYFFFPPSPSPALELMSEQRSDIASTRGVPNGSLDYWHVELKLS